MRELGRSVHPQHHPALREDWGVKGLAVGSLLTQGYPAFTQDPRHFQSDETPVISTQSQPHPPTFPQVFCFQTFSSFRTWLHPAFCKLCLNNFGQAWVSPLSYPSTSVRHQRPLFWSFGLKSISVHLCTLGLRGRHKLDPQILAE